MTKLNQLFFVVRKKSNLKKFVFIFRIELERVETTSSVQESIGIFQLIDQLETAVDNLLERQVQWYLLVQGVVIKYWYGLNGLGCICCLFPNQ
jgi:hypothetical protein